MDRETTSKIQTVEYLMNNCTRFDVDVLELTDVITGMQGASVGGMGGDGEIESAVKRVLQKEFFNWVKSHSDEIAKKVAFLIKSR